MVRAAVAAGLSVALAGAAVGQEPLAEARGVWLSLALTEAEGPVGVAERLAEHNMNMALLYYQAERAEQTREFISACHERDIEVHFWLIRPPVPEERRVKCLYYDYEKGLVEAGTCLSSEEYVTACEDAVKALVRDYEVDGIHLDEVGFGRPWQSLCPRCRERFARERGLAINEQTWPQDVIKLEQVSAENMRNSELWGGEHLDEWTQWRTSLVTDFIRRMAEAARSVREVYFSYALMPDSVGGCRFWYGEDRQQIAPLCDFLVTMTYYVNRGGDPAWTGRANEGIAAECHQTAPGVPVYGGVSTYGRARSYRIPVQQLFLRLLEEGKITTEQRTEHMHYRTCKQAFDSLEWLHEEELIEQEEYQQLRDRLEQVTPTDTEIVQAIESVREAGLPGVVFFRYACMPEGGVQGVIGDLWGKLTEVFAEPAVTPHSLGPRETAAEQ